jgi:hypothetical protein
MKKYKNPKKIEFIIDFDLNGTIMTKVNKGQKALAYVNYFFNGEGWTEGLLENGEKFKVPDMWFDYVK